MSDLQWHWYTGPRLYACRVNNNTEAALKEAVRLFQLRYPHVTPRMTQGSMFGHGGGATQSAGTHNGSGVIDMAVSNLTDAQADYLTECLRRVGFAAWRRFSWQANWPNHIHAVRIGDKGLHPTAAAQVRAYRNHRDGLAGNRRDTLNRWVGVTDWETYKRKHPLPKPKPTPQPAPPAPTPKGLLDDMAKLPDTERKTPIRLTAGQELVLPIKDNGDPSVIIGTTPDFTTKLTVRIADLPAGQTVRFRAAQYDYRKVDGKGQAKAVIFGGMDAQNATSDGAPIERAFTFDGAVQAPEKGFSRRVRFVAVADADCTITYLTTTGTRKA